MLLLWLQRGRRREEGKNGGRPLVFGKVRKTHKKHKKPKRQQEELSNGASAPSMPTHSSRVSFSTSCKYPTRVQRLAAMT